jgi:hypothetical protein
MKLPKLPNMQTIKSTAKSAMVTTKILGKKYAPFVLLGVGLVGYGYSVYAGVKSGKKLEVTKAKYEAKDAAGEEYTRMEVVKDVAKDVAIPVAVATASTAAIVLGFAIQTNRLKAVSSALAIVTEEHARYRLRAKEVLDEATFKKIDAPLETKTVELDGQEVEVESIVPNEGDFYGQWFKYSSNYVSDDPDYNESYIKEAETYLVNRMMKKGVLTFGEVLDKLGFDVPRAALPFGWTDTDDFYIEWDAHEVFDDVKQEYDLQFYVRWKTPRNLYATTSFKDFVPKKTRKELN